MHGLTGLMPHAQEQKENPQNSDTQYNQPKNCNGTKNPGILYVIGYYLLTVLYNSFKLCFNIIVYYIIVSQALSYIQRICIIDINVYRTLATELFFFKIIYHLIFLNKMLCSAPLLIPHFTTMVLLYSVHMLPNKYIHYRLI